MVYSVPRIRKCTSYLFMRLANLFGNEGGFDLVLSTITRDETELNADLPEGSVPMNLNILGMIIHNMSIPYQIYSKHFITAYGPTFVSAVLNRLRSAPEKSLRDVRRERIESIIKSIDNFNRRLIAKEERERQTETLKLEVALICLKSSFLERRIQGIKDLN